MWRAATPGVMIPLIVGALLNPLSVVMFGGAAFFIADGSPLQGQSEHVANLQLGWEDDTARSQATLIVNFVSERITARGA